MPAALLYSGVINTTSFTKIRQCLLAKVIYTDRETDRQTERQTDRQTDRQTSMALCRKQ